MLLLINWTVNRLCVDQGSSFRLMKRKGLVLIEPQILFYSLDPNIMKMSGRILMVADLARKYGFKDVGGVLVYLVSIRASLIKLLFLFW